MSKQFTFEAIGTHFWIEIFDEISDKELETTKGRLELLSSYFNERYSRFRADSWISKLNRDRIFKDPDEEFCFILNYGKKLYTESEGVFNLLIGHIIEARGYDATYSFRAVDGADMPSTCNPLTDLSISKEEISLICGNVDIGGYGKGYLVDKLSNDLKQHDVNHFLINGGGDMYATSDKNGEAIKIYLEHPTEDGTYLLETSLQNQGFAASSPFKRTWNHEGKTYTHIISDTHVPEIATFVKAKTAVDADAFATASLLLGEEQLLRIIEQEPNLSFAHYTPATNGFWQTKNFDAV